MFSTRQIILLLTPPLLLATTYLAYRLLVPRLGCSRGYLAGFLFYWIGWCLILPLALLGTQAVYPNRAPGGNLSLVVVATVLGLLWGWVAYASGSIVWTVVSHVLFDSSGLGGRVYFAEG